MGFYFALNVLWIVGALNQVLRLIARESMLVFDSGKVAIRILSIVLDRKPDSIFVVFPIS